MPKFQEGIKGTFGGVPINLTPIDRVITADEATKLTEAFAVIDGILGASGQPVPTGAEVDIAINERVPINLFGFIHVVEQFNGEFFSRVVPDATPPV